MNLTNITLYVTIAIEWDWESQCGNVAGLLNLPKEVDVTRAPRILEIVKKSSGVAVSGLNHQLSQSYSLVCGRRPTAAHACNDPPPTAS